MNNNYIILIIIVAILLIKGKGCSVKENFTEKN